MKTPYPEIIAQLEKELHKNLKSVAEKAPSHNQDINMNNSNELIYTTQLTILIQKLYARIEDSILFPVHASYKNSIKILEKALKTEVDELIENNTILLYNIDFLLEFTELIHQTAKAGQISKKLSNKNTKAKKKT